MTPRILTISCGELILAQKGEHYAVVWQSSHRKHFSLGDFPNQEHALRARRQIEAELIRHMGSMVELPEGFEDNASWRQAEIDPKTQLYQPLQRGSRHESGPSKS
jgi:hypothetical protein